MQAWEELIYNVGACGGLWGEVGRRAIRRLRLKPTPERMFLGQYKYTTDSKGRLTIPVRFRAALAGGAIITQGFDPNLIVYALERFKAIADKASALTTTDPEARSVRRVIFGNATEISLDSAGRILLPDFLTSNLGIDGEVHIVGAGEYFEIWSAAAWKPVHEDVLDSDANARRFADYDLSTG